MSIYIDEFEKMYNVSGNLLGLRDKVLDLAVQGKLIKQNEVSESANDLYLRIEKIRQEWIEQGRAKKTKKSDRPQLCDLSFDVPESWSVIRLIDLAKFIDYRGKTPKKTEDGIPLITAKNIKYGYIDENPREYIAEGDFDSWMTRGIPDKGNVVFTTEAPLANVARLNRDDKYALAQRAITFNTYVSDVDGFLFRALMSPSLREVIFELATGTTVLGIKASRLKEVLIPLPPIEEQILIEKRIEELFVVIDQLEKKLRKKEHLMKLLPQAVVDAIGSCQTGEELKTQLEFVIENFEEIFQTSESMQDLRNVILQLAIEGKLVEQDENDEPARVLVERIKSERDQLVKEKKIKKPKKLELITEDEIPFEIPESWEFERIGNLITEIFGGGTPNKSNPKYWNGDIKWASVKDFSDSDVYLSDTVDRITELGLDESSSRIVSTGNFIVSTRMGLGRIVITQDDIAINQDLKGIKLSNKFNQMYFYLAYKSLNIEGTGTTVKGIKQDELLNLLIPVPPRLEQDQIVTRFKALMIVIDEMEVKMKKKQQIVELLGTV